MECRRIWPLSSAVQRLLLSTLSGVYERWARSSVFIRYWIYVFQSVQLYLSTLFTAGSESRCSLRQHWRPRAQCCQFGYLELKDTLHNLYWLKNHTEGRRLKMDVLQSWINFGVWGGVQGVCRCTDSAAFHLESLEANHLYKQTQWKRSRQTVLLPNCTLNVRWLMKLWSTEKQSRLFRGKYSINLDFFPFSRSEETHQHPALSELQRFDSWLIYNARCPDHYTSPCVQDYMLNSSLFTFTQICNYRHGEHVAATNTWNDRYVRIPHCQKKSSVSATKHLCLWIINRSYIYHWTVQIGKMNTCIFCHLPSK